MTVHAVSSDLMQVMNRKLFARFSNKEVDDKNLKTESSIPDAQIRSGSASSITSTASPLIIRRRRHWWRPLTSLVLIEPALTRML